ncbi:MAG TPA: single-stranded DNA-binding protein [Thermoanaerobaculia bacterium]|nr:single-stranded DNA-binding protein [Thermoanaerobaculia bacterium]HUM28735.1 single-stranded DNA-binding protein [Thermoanaerobaculia bacterium]HXK68015.1 single-stranded DNA-binding protein [Thermoanaerobaculia bacterium]
MSLNKVILVGRVGQDPEIRATQTGVPVANFTLATNDYWRDKSTGERRERTEWHRIVAWDRQAQFCGDYVRKGMLILVEGSLQTRSWEGKDGQKRSTTEIRIQNIQMLERKGSTGDSDGMSDDLPPDDLPPEGDVPF